MTNGDREWLEAHLRGPIMARFDRVEHRIDTLFAQGAARGERIAKVEVRSGLVSAFVSAVVAALAVLSGVNR